MGKKERPNRCRHFPNVGLADAGQVAQRYSNWLKGKIDPRRVESRRVRGCGPKAHSKAMAANPIRPVDPEATPPTLSTHISGSDEAKKAALSKHYPGRRRTTLGPCVALADDDTL
jgi:hypothetical protein